MAYRDFKYLTRRTFTDKKLREKEFNITKNPNMMDINVDLLQWFIRFLIKRLQMFLLNIKSLKIRN